MSDPQSPCQPRSRGATRHVLLLAALAAALGGCQWNAWVPKGPKTDVHVPRERVIPLHLGEPRKHALDCPSGQCEQRFRIVLHRGGTLHVHIDAEEDSDQMGLRVVLQDPIKRVLQIIPVSVEPPLDLRHPVEYGPYLVLVQAIGGRIPFEIRADLEPYPERKPGGAS